MKIFVLVGESGQEDDLDYQILGVFDHKPMEEELKAIKTKITRFDIRNKPYQLSPRIYLETWENNSLSTDVEAYETLSWEGL